MTLPAVHARRIPVLPPNVPGAGSLGRHVRHDPRSRDYPFQVPRGALKSAVHIRRIPVLDQGALGSCTGNAGVGTLGTDPFFHSLDDLGQLTFDEAMAVDIYGSATRIDPFAGSYPPDDTGSDGLSVAKVLKQRGLISGYQHTFTTNDALLALSVVPWITGVNWYSSFDQPQANGEIRVSSSAYIRGGHEFEGSEIDVENRRVWFWNSWGTTYGIGGRMWASFDTFDRLLHEEGDVTVFVPRGTPEPQPTPDAVLAEAFRRDDWVTSRHVGGNGRVAKAAAAWLKAKGL